MHKIDDILACIKEMAPEELAEHWDNCGLTVASETESAECVVVCLDVTREVIEEAINSRARLIISHHPLIFNPIKQISCESRLGPLLRALIKNDVALYTAHTNVDKTYGGLNDLLAGIIGIETPHPDDACAQLSYFRVGEMPRAYTADGFNKYVSARLRMNDMIISSGTPPGKLIKKVLVMSGAYSLETRQVAATGADAVVCGEMRHHEVLELTALGAHIVQAGHHGTERFFIQLIEKWITDRFPDMPVKGVGFINHPSIFFHGENVNGDV